MIVNNNKQLNFYSLLYQNIPENHILKRIDSAVSFEFINKKLEGNYSKNLGRPAKEPEMMMKLLMLQEMYGLSEIKVMEEAQINLAFMWYIGINPGDPLPHPSLLSKFKTLRLKDVSMDDILTDVVRQCVEKGIIKAEDGVSVDATHILANTTKKVPERIMKHLAKRIFKAMEQTEYEIPDYTQIEDHEEAKRVMKEYLEGVMDEADERAKDEVEKAREIIESPLFMEQKGIRSIVDTDARVGYKTKTDSFFGYKAEFTMTTGSQLITAVNVRNGAYMDGVDFEGLYNLTKKAGIDVEAIYGDKAYFKKAILDMLKRDGVKAYIPVNASSYRVDEDLFAYNKDSDQWVCVRGNRTVSKKVKNTNNKDRGESQCYEYVFEKAECIGCPLRDECIMKANTKAKKLRVGVNTGEYYEHSQWAKTDEFLEEYKKRAAIEGKNSELKRFHGLARAKGFGLQSVSFQTKMTAIAVNLKRIAALVSSSESVIDEGATLASSFEPVITIFSFKFRAISCSYAILHIISLGSVFNRKLT